MKKIFIGALVALGLMMQNSEASTINLGLAPAYSSFTLYNAGTDSPSIYRGIGGIAEIRYKMMSNFALTDGVGTDIFAMYQYDKASNIAKSVAESMTRSAYGFGFDITFSLIYLGLQYQHAVAVVTPPSGMGLKTSLTYDTFGVRTGLNIGITQSFFIQLGFVTQQGVALAKPNDLKSPQPIMQMSGYLSANIPLMRDAPF